MPSPIKQPTQRPYSKTAAFFSLLATSLSASVAAASGALDLADADAVYELDRMNVEASDEVGAGWRPTRQVTATRISTPLEDVPRSVSVITAEVMSDLGEERIDRALDFAGGVTRGNDFGGMNISGYNVRGFTTGAMYRNGFSSGKGTNSQPDASTIERVEVLKGPSSGLFGRADPGGIVNLVTKRPQRERFTRISASAGSWERQRPRSLQHGPRRQRQFSRPHRDAPLRLRAERQLAAHAPNPPRPRRSIRAQRQRLRPWRPGHWREIWPSADSQFLRRALQRKN